MTVRIGLVGAGSMGSLHARVVSGNETTELCWVADPSEDVGTNVADRFGTRWIPEPELANIDAVIVASPTQFHQGVALEVIRSGLPMLLEKPLADTYAHSAEIVAAAAKAGTILMCGLLERFNPAVRTAAEIAKAPLRVATLRHSPYSARIRTGVASDLLIHDADMVLRLIGAEASRVVAEYGYFSPTSELGSEDVAEALARFPGGEVATLSASRLSQHKVRTLTIAELGRLIDVDLLRQSITVYRNVEGATFDEEAGYSQQTIIDIPVVRHTGEPLQLQLQHFVSLIEGRGDAAGELASLLAPHRFVDRVRASATDERQ